MFIKRILVFSCIFLHCKGFEENKKLLSLPHNEPCISLKNAQTIYIKGVAVDIFLPPKKAIGTILILPGWNFPKDDWCKKSSLCKKALAEGYILVMPEMGKSIYTHEIYPETRIDWRKYPTMDWITADFLPFLQEKYYLFLEKDKNFIVGLSTGARGAALIALEEPNLFKGIAALSGDYNQSLMPQDNLMIGFYGSYKKFPERWLGKSNIANRAKRFKTPLYLGHGKKDAVVPYTQTVAFCDSLSKYNPDLKTIINFGSQAGHDYLYWNSEVENILFFFKNL